MYRPVLRALVLAVLAAARAASADVILHAFDWKYTDVEKAAGDIAAAGYRAVLVAPPLKTERSSDCPWFKRYQPEDLRVIDGCNGNKEEFVAMVKALAANNVRVYADVVVNHMANERSNATAFPGNDAIKAYARKPAYWERQRLYGNLHVGLFSPQDFHPERCIWDYLSVEQVVNGRICGQGGDRGLPDLDDDVPWVTDQRRQYVQALYALGVRGFRLDAAKHMSPSAIRAFVPDEVAGTAHVFGEIITWGGVSDREYGLYLKPFLEQLPATFAAYDFPLLNTLKNAFAPGARLGDHLANPYANGNALEWRRAVTVAVTHDVPYGFRNLILDPTDEDLAYAYLLGRDGGTPLVFDDGSSWKSDGGRWVGAWKRDRLRRMIDFHNRMQGKPMEVLHADDCSLLWRRQEDGIAAINKCGFDVQAGVDTRGKLKWNVRYVDTLDPGETVEITGAIHTFRIPARGARMYVAQ